MNWWNIKQIWWNLLSNIGLYYNTLNDAIEAKLTSGIIYILDQNKFYYINNGEYQEY